MPSRAKNIIFRMRRGFAAQGFSQAVLIFIRFAEVPLFLGFWGTQLYGEWLMVAAIPAYLALGDGGFATAAIREMTIRVAAKDRSGALSVFHSISALLLVISLGLILLAAGTVSLLPLSDWLGFQAIRSGELNLIILLLTIHVLFNFQSSLLYGGFQCEKRYATGMVLMTITQLLEFIGLASVVALGGGPVEAATAYLAGRICGLAIMRLGLYRVAPWFHYGWQKVTRVEIARLIGPAFASLAFPLGNALNIQGMRLIVGLVLGPETVPIFTTLRTLSQLAAQPKEIIKRLVQPEMGMAFGSGDTNLFGLLFLHSSRIALWSSVLVCSLLVITGEYLLSLWTGGSIIMHWGLFTFLLLASIVNSLWNIAMQTAASINRHGRIAAMFSIVYGGLAFVMAYFSTNIVGLPGIGITLFFIEIVMAFYVVPIAGHMGEKKLMQWIKFIVSPPRILLKVIPFERRKEKRK